MRLGILLDGDNGIPLNVASVRDTGLLRAVAEAAIQEAEVRAACEPDQRIRLVRDIESCRLRLTLEGLIPGLMQRDVTLTH